MNNLTIFFFMLFIFLNTCFLSAYQPIESVFYNLFELRKKEKDVNQLVISSRKIIFNKKKGYNRSNPVKKKTSTK